MAPRSRLEIHGTGPRVTDVQQPRVGRPGPEHAGEVLTVQRAAYVTEAQRYDTPHIPPLIESLAELRADLAVDSPLLVARAVWLGPRLVGSVRGRVAGAEMEVARLTVAPDLQGRGLGRALLDAVHAAAPAGVSTCWLLTGARSDDNIRLYARAGSRHLARRATRTRCARRSRGRRPRGTVG
ncbi:MAG: GNAT family N-acetyltransferase, partial [Pseudonocardia sp.]|nr:GNAT family N-acetyltransferase [Pseudonocardia sp.]